MRAKKFACELREIQWIAPTVMRVVFESEKKIDYEAGQFLSLIVPPREEGAKPVKRAYTFATSPEEAQRAGHEICVKYLPGGAGSEYLKSLTPGSSLEIMAPYGDFTLPSSRITLSRDRHLCLIATGTGLAPFRAMMLSETYREHAEEGAESLCLFGARSADEILYPEFLGEIGRSIPGKSVIALSRADDSWSGFKGRVTDYLRTLPNDWMWHTTDFYLCGNSAMIEEVRRILIGGRGVDPRAIRQELFF